MFNAWINMGEYRGEYKRYLLNRRKRTKDSSARPRYELSINLARNYAFVATLDFRYVIPTGTQRCLESTCSLRYHASHQ